MSETLDNPVTQKEEFDRSAVYIDRALLFIQIRNYTLFACIELSRISFKVASGSSVSPA